jgi:hypothetical protein
MLLSLKVGLASTLRCACPLRSVVAWLLSRSRLPGRALLDGIVHAPLVLPPVVIGYLLLISLGTRAPLGAWLKTNFGIQLIFTMRRRGGGRGGDGLSADGAGDPAVARRRRPRHRTRCDERWAPVASMCCSPSRCR